MPGRERAQRFDTSNQVAILPKEQTRQPEAEAEGQDKGRQEPAGAASAVEAEPDGENEGGKVNGTGGEPQQEARQGRFTVSDHGPDNQGHRPDVVPLAKVCRGVGQQQVEGGHRHAGMSILKMVAADYHQADTDHQVKQDRQAAPHPKFGIHRADVVVLIQLFHHPLGLFTGHARQDGGIRLGEIHLPILPIEDDGNQTDEEGSGHPGQSAQVEVGLKNGTLDQGQVDQATD